MTTTATPPAATAAAARPAPHPFRSELLRGSAPWTGLAVAVTLSIALAGKASQWQGSWEETQALLHTAGALLGGPLAAAAGCWQGGRERRRRTDELRASAARAPLAQFLTASLPTAGWNVAGYGVVAAGTLAATWPYTSAGRPLIAPILMDAAFLAAMTLLGHVVGRLVAWRAAAPALAVCCYVLLGIPSYGTSGARHLSPASAEAMGEMIPVWWQPLAAIAWTGGLAAAAVLAYAARRRSTALLPLAAAAVAGVVIAQTGDGMWRPHPLAQRQVCDTSVRPHICVNALRSGLLPEVRNALAPLQERLEGVDNLPVRFEDLVGEPGPDEAQLPMLTPLGWIVVRGELTDPEQYAWEGAAAITGSHDACDARAEDERARRVDMAVTDWLAPVPVRQTGERDILELAGEAGDEVAIARVGADRAARARLAAMPDDARRDWLSRYFATVHNCDPKEVPVL
ncbi:hypothetical protein J7E88_08355 [Streptomyces sp. ISL-10]|uniref:hypothetical protein n=1 Tax=Streptomyces sp. ISL-10 TaxID=2819172 RepID=UPI001BEBBACE|nr:hypothetical protein [Streptomyces sp. ISL-10]MBT2365333.1 hypothetical protein [Streptomyces sp. ISL-10]